MTGEKTDHVYLRIPRTALCYIMYAREHGNATKNLRKQHPNDHISLSGETSEQFANCLDVVNGAEIVEPVVLGMSYEELVASFLKAEAESKLAHDHLASTGRALVALGEKMKRQSVGEE